MPTTPIAQRIAELDAQIASIEDHIFQQKKRVENLLAKGGDVSEPQSVIATLSQTLEDLQTRKAGLEQQAHQ